MQKHSKRVLVASLFLFMTGIRAEMNSDFSIGASLESFLNTFVPENDRARFVNYYNKFSELFRLADKDKQSAAHVELFKKAIAHLKKNKGDKYDVVIARVKQLRSCKEVDPKTLQDTQQFLLWYGAYVDFIELMEKFAHFKQMETFVDKKFGDFLERIVEQENRKAFAGYYEKFMDSVSKHDSPKRIATYQDLFKKALNHMRLVHTDWHKVLSTYAAQENMDDPVFIKARLFLLRYGAYRNFLDRGFFVRVGAFFTSVLKTIVGWFGFGVTQTD